MVELLLVIAIISVLASLLLSAFKKVRDSAKSIQFVNNQKQIGYTLMSYAGDWNDYLVSTSCNGYVWGIMLVNNNYIESSEALYIDKRLQSQL